MKNGRIPLLLAALLCALHVSAQLPPDAASDTAAPAYDDEVTGLSFQDVPVRSVLQVLADFYDFNLVVSGAAEGNITLRLDEVPWNQALEMVLRTGDLASRLEGNILYVAPAAEIAAQDAAALQAAQRAQALAPLHTEFVQVNYADAGDILALITGGGTARPSVRDSFSDDNAAAGILSPRGSARVDPRTNLIILRDTAEKLAELRALTARLDIPVRQVLIEARIVNVSTDYGRDLGIRWGGGGSNRSSGSGFHYGGSLDATVEEAANQLALQLALQNADLAGRMAALQAMQDGLDQDIIKQLVQNAVDGVPIPVGATTFPAALAVDLGVARSGASSFAIGYTGSSGIIELELSALESSGNGEVIARPKVTTQDKTTALIQSGVRIPYQSQAGGTAGGSTTEFEEAVLSLEVTPQITPDGRIDMRLDIRQDSVAAAGGPVPAINTNQVATSALVDDGETIVLGGVFREETVRTETKTPLLSDIPLLGRLFRRTENASRRTELLIFITPTIVTPEGQ